MDLTKAVLVTISIGVLSGCNSSKQQDSARLTCSERPAETPSRLVRFRDGDKYGFKTTKGKVLIPATYDDARDFTCGLAPVNIGARWKFPGFKDGGKWGYINQRGEVVIPIDLDYAWAFSDGLARVHQSWQMRYIDTSGRTVIKLAKPCGRDFSEGLAALDWSVKHGTNWTWLTDYIDTQGKKVLSVEASGQEFHEGLAAAGVPNPGVPVGDHMGMLYGFIDRTGKWAINPAYAEVREFSDGLASVRPKKTTILGRGDSWGYVNRAGELVIGLQFNEAHSFSHGFALVHVGGKLHELMDAPSYWEGGKWMIIDRQGKPRRTSDTWIDVKAFAEKVQDNKRNSSS